MKTLLQSIQHHDYFDDAVEIEIVETIESTAATLTRFKAIKQREAIPIIYKVFREQWLGGGRAELTWYAQFAPLITPGISPFYYGGEINGQTRHGYLFLEDLTETHDRLSESWSSSPENLAWLEAVVDILLQLHIFWWDQDSLADDLFLRPQGGPLRLAHATSPETMTKYAQAMQKSFPHIVDSLQSDLDPDWIVICEQAIDRWPGLLAERTHHQQNLTLIHGDFHIWNLFFPHHRQHNRLLIADWETYKRGIGVYDLAYLLLTSLDVSLRREEEKKLLRRYYDGLQAAGIGGYGWADCVQDYRLSIIANLFPPLMWKSAASVRQVMAAFDDWDCGHLLAES